MKDSAIIPVWPRRTSVALAVALAVQTAFLAVWIAETTDPPSTDVSRILIGLNAFAMGIQINAVRRLRCRASLPRLQLPLSSAW